jgi:carboxymethylenebutenolidase
MQGDMVQFKANDETYQGYLASSVHGKGPGIIVIQEWWGLVDHIKEVVDRFASEGYTALAPDFYLGKVAKEPDAAGRHMMAINIRTTEQILKGAVDLLLTHSAVQGEKVGVVGFCMGGQLSLYAACVNPKIGAAVDFYGVHPNVQPDFDQLKAPVLGIFAGKDEYVTPEVVSKLDRQLRAANAKYEFVTYSHASHAFFNDSRPEVYDPNASEDAWRRVSAFFMKNLSLVRN